MDKRWIISESQELLQDSKGSSQMEPFFLKFLPDKAADDERRRKVNHQFLKDVDAGLSGEVSNVALNFAVNRKFLKPNRISSKPLVAFAAQEENMKLKKGNEKKSPVRQNLRSSWKKCRFINMKFKNRQTEKRVCNVWRIETIDEADNCQVVKQPEGERDDRPAANGEPAALSSGEIVNESEENKPAAISGEIVKEKIVPADSSEVGKETAAKESPAVSGEILKEAAAEKKLPAISCEIGNESVTENAATLEIAKSAEKACQTDKMDNHSHNSQTAVNGADRSNAITLREKLSIFQAMNRLLDHFDELVTSYDLLRKEWKLTPIAKIDFFGIQDELEGYICYTHDIIGQIIQIANALDTKRILFLSCVELHNMWMFHDILNCLLCLYRNLKSTLTSSEYRNIISLIIVCCQALSPTRKMPFNDWIKLMSDTLVACEKTMDTGLRRNDCLCRFSFQSLVDNRKCSLCVLNSFSKKSTVDKNSNTSAVSVLENNQQSLSFFSLIPNIEWLLSGVKNASQLRVKEAIKLHGQKTFSTCHPDSGLDACAAHRSVRACNCFEGLIQSEKEEEEIGSQQSLLKKTDELAVKAKESMDVDHLSRSKKTEAVMVRTEENLTDKPSDSEMSIVEIPTASDPEVFWEEKPRQTKDWFSDDEFTLTYEESSVKETSNFCSVDGEYGSDLDLFTGFKISSNTVSSDTTRTPSKAELNKYRDDDLSKGSTARSDQTSTKDTCNADNQEVIDLDRPPCDSWSPIQNAIKGIAQTEAASNNKIEKKNTLKLQRKLIEKINASDKKKIKASDKKKSNHISTAVPDETSHAEKKKKWSVFDNFAPKHADTTTKSPRKSLSLKRRKDQASESEEEKEMKIKVKVKGRKLISPLEDVEEENSMDLKDLSRKKICNDARKCKKKSDIPPSHETNYKLKINERNGEINTEEDDDDDWTQYCNSVFNQLQISNEKLRVDYESR